MRSFLFIFVIILVSTITAACGDTINNYYTAPEDAFSDFEEDSTDVAVNYDSDSTTNLDSDDDSSEEEVTDLTEITEITEINEDLSDDNLEGVDTFDTELSEDINTTTTLYFSLSDNTPLAQMVENGARSVPYLTIDLAGEGHIDSLEFQRFGIGSFSAFKYFYIYADDELIAQISTFADAEALSVPIGRDFEGEIELSLYADLGPHANGDMSAFRLADVSVPQGTLVEFDGEIEGNFMHVVNDTFLVIVDAVKPNAITTSESENTPLEFSVEFLEEGSIGNIEVSAEGSALPDLLTLYQGGDFQVDIATKVEISAYSARYTFVVDTHFEIGNYDFKVMSNNYSINPESYFYLKLSPPTNWGLEDNDGDAITNAWPNYEIVGHTINFEP